MVGWSMGSIPYQTLSDSPNRHSLIFFIFSPLYFNMSTEISPKDTNLSKSPADTAHSFTASTLSSPVHNSHGSKGGLASATASSSTELSSLEARLREALVQFPDFPQPGILFEDILPIFKDVNLHRALITSLETKVLSSFPAPFAPQVIVGLESRGFLFGPSLALQLNAAFVPVRKRGKLPGPTLTATYTKEYGEDQFEMQADAVREGQRVLVVDDIIATGMVPRLVCHFASAHPMPMLMMLLRHTTGGSAAAAGSLVKKAGGTLLGYVFLLELAFLNGRAKLDAPAHTLLST